MGKCVDTRFEQPEHLGMGLCDFCGALCGSWDWKWSPFLCGIGFDRFDFLWCGSGAVQTKGEAVDVSAKLPASGRPFFGRVSDLVADGTVRMGVTNGGCLVVSAFDFGNLAVRARCIFLHTVAEGKPRRIPSDEEDAQKQQVVDRTHRTQRLCGRVQRSPGRFYGTERCPCNDSSYESRCGHICGSCSDSLPISGPGSGEQRAVEGLLCEEIRCARENHTSLLGRRWSGETVGVAHFGCGEKSGESTGGYDCFFCWCYIDCLIYHEPTLRVTGPTINRKRREIKEDP